MDLNLQGKVAVVTGGTRGIGRCIVETLGAEGARVVFCARKPEEVEEAKAHFGVRGIEVRGSVADVADGAAYAAFLEQAQTAFGGVDVFVPNVSAGGGMGGEAPWRRAFEVDILGVVRGCEALGPAIAARGGGSIVLITTTAASEAFAAPQAYNAMKAASANYMKNLSVALAGQRVRVNAVSPGPIYFEGGAWAQRETSAPEVFNRIVAQIPLGRMGSPQDVANAVAFLASEVSGHVTGTTITVDGGFTKRVQF